jgi:hypothetical protein
VGTLVFGYWGTTGSSFSILAVPIEVMLTCFFGGAAWALYVLSAHTSFISKYRNQSNPSLRYSLILLNLLFFGAGGATAEWSLIERGVMYYDRGWTRLCSLFRHVDDAACPLKQAETLRGRTRGHNRRQ